MIDLHIHTTCSDGSDSVEEKETEKIISTLKIELDKEMLSSKNKKRCCSANSYIRR